MADETVNDVPPAFDAAIDDATMQRMESGAQAKNRGQQRRCALVTIARDSETLLRTAQDEPEAYEEFGNMVLDFHEFAKAQLEIAEAAVARLKVIEGLRQAA